jgi:glucuronoarabinoxylan endo-1,4-beta-xylanase
MIKMKLNHMLNKSHNLFLFYLLNIFFFSHLCAQTYTIDGTISVSTTTVQSALVTFIDMSDTTKKFSALTDDKGNYQLEIVTSLEHSKISLPTKFELSQNYPNPFSSKTSISYKLKEQADVQVTIYDVLGRTVRKFTVNAQVAGTHQIMWDGVNNFGQRLAAGIYFYQFRTAGESQIKKMILVAGAGTNTGIGIISSSPMLHLPKSKAEKQNRLTGGNYRVKIENTAETFPMIVPETHDNQDVQDNATVNFSVSSLYPIANSDIELDSTRQMIRGFGAANILPWRPDMTADEIEKAFGTGDGQIGFSILRLRVPTNQNEFSMNVSTAKAAYDMGVTIMASPWSPPASMKTNNNTVSGRLKEESYADYAAHLKSFADYMYENGVPIHSISVQNEPDVEVTYESCDWNADEMLKFMKENAPGVGVPVCAPESFNFNKSMSNPILNDPGAIANTAYISGHIYGGGLEPYPLAIEKGKELWMTEHLVLETDWNHVFATGKEIHDCMNAGMSAYIWWYIVRFYGPIIDDDDRRPPGTEKGDVSKRGFVMSHFARFIRPGYNRVNCNSFPQRNVYISSYKENNSKITIVALNISSSPIYQTFSVINGDVNTIIPYTTTSSKNCTEGNEVTVTNGRFTVLLEPSSISTFYSH